MISKIKEQKNKSSSQYVGKWTEDCSLKRRVQIWINTFKNVQYLAIKEMQTTTRRRIRLWWFKFVISSDTRRLTKFKANVRPFFKKTKNQTKVILVFHIDLVRVAIIKMLIGGKVERKKLTIFGTWVKFGKGACQKSWEEVEMNMFKLHSWSSLKRSHS